MDYTAIKLKVFTFLWSVSGYEGTFPRFRVGISLRNSRSSPWKSLRRSDTAKMNIPTANLPSTCNITLQRCVKVLFHRGAKRCWWPESMRRSVARWPPTVVHVIALQDIPVKWEHEEANLVSSSVVHVPGLQMHVYKINSQAEWCRKQQLFQNNQNIIFRAVKTPWSIMVLHNQRTGLIPYCFHFLTSLATSVKLQSTKATYSCANQFLQLKTFIHLNSDSLRTT